MTFFRKLLYYLLGVGLGVLAVIFFFGDRDIGCSYFPNDRVLSDLRKKEISISPEMEAKLESRGLDTANISMMLLSGDIDFKKSNTQNEDTCHWYWIDFSQEGQQSFSAQWMNCDSVAYLVEVY